MNDQVARENKRSGRTMIWAAAGAAAFAFMAWLAAAATGLDEDPTTTGEEFLVVAWVALAAAAVMFVRGLYLLKSRRKHRQRWPSRTRRMIWGAAGAGAFWFIASLAGVLLTLSYVALVAAGLMLVRGLYLLWTAREHRQRWPGRT